MLKETKDLLAAMAAAGAPPIYALEPHVARSLLTPMVMSLDSPAADVATVSEISIPSAAGAIPARLYTPYSLANNHHNESCALVFYHGGGWVLGDLDQYDALCRDIADRLALRVVSVAYRLAPEQVFPAAYDDALASALWVQSSPAELGAPVTSYLLAGDSAGGNLAAAVSASGLVKPIAQLLIYPVTDVSQQSASYQEFADGYFLDRATMAWFCEQYLPDMKMRLDVRASPLLNEDLSHVPPTIIMTAEYDVLRDEGLAYGAKLKQHGRQVIELQAKGLIHGMASFRGALPTGAKEIVRLLDQLAALLEGLRDEKTL